MAAVSTRILLGRLVSAHASPPSLLRLKNESATYISLSSEYLQSYKFFQPYRKEIISLFEFGYTMREEADDYAATTLP